jgi:hypothetical protein
VIRLMLCSVNTLRPIRSAPCSSTFRNYLTIRNCPLS